MNHFSLQLNLPSIFLKDLWSYNAPIDEKLVSILRLSRNAKIDSPINLLELELCASISLSVFHQGCFFTLHCQGIDHPEYNLIKPSSPVFDVK